MICRLAAWASAISWRLQRGDVDRVALHLEQPRRAVGDGLIGQGLVGGHGVPVVVERLHVDLDAGLFVDELPRAGADRVMRRRVGVRLDVLLRGDEEVVVGVHEQVGQVVVRLGQLDVELERADDLDVVDIAADGLVQLRAGVLVGVFAHPLAIGELDIVGRHRAVVAVELDVGPELEVPRLAVVGDAERLREHAHDFLGVGIDVDQRVEHHLGRGQGCRHPSHAVPRCGCPCRRLLFSAGRRRPHRRLRRRLTRHCEHATR